MLTSINSRKEYVELWEKIANAGFRIDYQVQKMDNIIVCIVKFEGKKYLIEQDNLLVWAGKGTK